MPTGSGPNDGGNSRLHILPFFLLPVEWQREHRPLLAEWFVRRHREGVSELDGDRD